MGDKEYIADAAGMAVNEEYLAETGRTQESGADHFSHVEKMAPPTKRYEHGITLDEADRLIMENVKEAVRNVIAIGYYLKYIRDNRLYEEHGCPDIWSYAADRYGFSKSTTSRYMSRNDKFSVDGNSPVLAEEYRDYSKAQLQEMLSLNDEQLAQITPDMSVREIREVRKPKEIPYYEIPGQQDFSEYFGVDESPAVEKTSVAEPPAVYTMQVSDLLPDESSERKTSMSLPEALRNRSEIPENAPESQRSGVCLYRPDHKCTLLDIHKQVPGDGTNCTEKCCWGCTASEGCNIKCYSASSRAKMDQPVVAAPQQEKANLESKKVQVGLKNPDAQVFKILSICANKLIQARRTWFETQYFSVNRHETTLAPLLVHELGMNNRSWFYSTEDGIKGHINLFDNYVQVWDGFECIGNFDWMHLSRAIIESWNAHGKVESPEDDVVDEPDSYNRSILTEMIKDTKEALGIMQDHWIENQPHTYQKYMMQLQAYEMLLTHHDEVVVPEPIEQPELPVLKNNDQRKEWIQSYRDWPVWFEVPEASEIYYRYDFEDGSSFVICEYWYYIAWLEGAAGKDPERKGTREYILKPGYHYLEDCRSNTTAMIEHLKEVQKR